MYLTSLLNSGKKMGFHALFKAKYISIVYIGKIVILITSCSPGGLNRELLQIDFFIDLEFSKEIQVHEKLFFKKLLASGSQFL